MTSCACGCSVAVSSERWCAPVKVTVSVPGPGCAVLVVKPSAGTAETRQTASAPKRTVTWPPTVAKLCAPAPPEQSARPALDGAGRGVVGAAGAVGDGRRVGDVGAPVADGVDGVDAGVPTVTGPPVPPGAAVASTVETPRAVGGSGAVDPTTKLTVRNTAVAVSAVQDSQIRK